MNIRPDEKIINNKISKIFLSECYNAKYSLSEGANIHLLKDKYNWVCTELNEVINHLENMNWIKCRDVNGYYITTGIGGEEIERRGWVDQNQLTARNKERIKLLKHFANKYVSENRFKVYTWGEFEKDFGKSYQEVAIYLGDFQDLGLFDRKRNRLTELGFQKFKKTLEFEKIKTEFDNLKDLTPQMRGRQVEKLFTRLLKLENWTVQHSVKNRNEENDIFISYERENYLIEIKWLKSSVEASEIRELIGKLSNRVGVAGIFFSISGFSAGAIEQVREQMSKVIIYLFGPNDIKSIIERHRTFNEHLSEKNTEIILRKKIVYS